MALASVGMRGPQESFALVLQVLAEVFEVTLRGGERRGGGCRLGCRLFRTSKGAWRWRGSESWQNRRQNFAPGTKVAKSANNKGG